MAMSNKEARAKRIAQGLKDLEENRRRQVKKKDTRTVDEMNLKAPKREESKGVSNKSNAEKSVDALRKNKGRIATKSASEILAKKKKAKRLKELLEESRNK